MNNQSLLTNRKQLSAWALCTLRVHLRPCGASADECVVGKNYRLQNIQLSKITPGEISPRGIIGGRGALSPETPFAHSLAGLRCPTPLVRAAGDRFRSPPEIFKDHQEIARRSLIASSGELAVSGSPASPRGPNGLASKLVENTGLEPVTSWLQTRRSPS